MLKLKNVSKRLGHFALSGINIEIPLGEYYVLLGRSGSGKTQLLEVIAGLTQPDSGEIWLNKENITKRKIQKRNIGLVFQDYAIFPNMTVYGNIAYSLHSLGIERKRIAEMVNNIAREMNISQLMNRYTQNLSGGEMQRVALARTLVTSPHLLLLDEPMASIDASLKDDIKRVLRQINKGGLTIIHVTHDFREALSLAGRVGVIHNGHIIQEGKPDEVFRKPVNKFVARYAGIRNFFRVKFINDNGLWRAFASDKLVFIVAGKAYPTEGLLIIRSDDIRIFTEEPHISGENILKGTIKEIIPSDYGVEISVDAGEVFFIDITIENFRKLRLSEHAQVWIAFHPESLVDLEGIN
jgi:ABC-type Fe3+/spermidine/putrescine transport system ATPase subunit